MAGLKDFLFGGGSLKKAASTGDEKPTTSGPSQPAGLDIAGMAQTQANSTKTSGAPYPKTPSSLSSPMTPQSTNSKGK